MSKNQRQELLSQCISNKQSQKHTSQSSELSEKSITRYIENRLRGDHAINRRQIQQMNERVKNELMRNRKNYEKLVTLNPYFSMKLFSPQNVFTNEQYNQASINLMLKQLDLLLEDGHLLEKEIKKTQLRKMQSEHMNNYEVDNSKHHYAYIRKIWLGSNEADAKNPLERIEQLNKKVVLVKNNLYSLTDVQKKSYERMHSHNEYANVVSKINEIVQQTKEYTLFKQKYQSLKMSYQELEQKFGSLSMKLQQIQAEKNEVIRKLRQENEQCKKMLKDSKEKQLAVQLKQAQLLLKIKELENSFKQKRNDKNEVPLSIASLKSDVSKTRLVVNMDDIKFRKIQAKQIIITNNQKQKEPSTEPIKKIIEQRQTKEQTEPTVSRFSPNKQKSQNYNQMNERSFNIGDEKSPDGRKGRFIRMRSPGGGKLMKNKGSEEYENIKKTEILSPKFRESEGKNLISSEK